MLRLSVNISLSAERSAKHSRLADRVRRSRPVWKSKCYGASVLNRRVARHAIDASLLDGVAMLTDISHRAKPTEP